MINQLNNSLPIVDSDRQMIRRFSDWTKSVTKLDPFFGSGSPEESLEADQFRFYIDLEGTTGNILYVKQLSDIDGDKTRGWILV